MPTAITVKQLVRNTGVTAVGTCSFGNMTSSSEWHIPMFEDKTLLMAIWNACGTSTEKFAGLFVEAGDHWQSSLGEYEYVCYTTSCGDHMFLFGPFESAHFGTLATSTSYGAELNQNYLNVNLMYSSSSGVLSTGTAHTEAQGLFRVYAVQWPIVDWTT